MRSVQSTDEVRRQHAVKLTDVQRQTARVTALETNPASILRHRQYQLSLVFQRHTKSVIMAALWNRAGRYIFALWFVLCFFLFSLSCVSTAHKPHHHNRFTAPFPNHRESQCQERTSGLCSAMED